MQIIQSLAMGLSILTLAGMMSALHANPGSKTYIELTLNNATDRDKTLMLSFDLIIASHPAIKQVQQITIPPKESHTITFEKLPVQCIPNTYIHVDFKDYQFSMRAWRPFGIGSVLYFTHHFDVQLNLKSLRLEPHLGGTYFRKIYYKVTY